MKCSNCHHEQASGKFCGACGSALIEEETLEVESTSTTAPVPGHTSSNTSAMENVRNYWDRSLRFIQQPLEAFRATDKSVTQGLITLFLFMLSFTLSLYFLLNSFAKVLTLGWMEAGEPFSPSQSLPFYEISSRIFLFSLAGVVISLLAIMIMTKLLKHPFCIKTIVAQYGALLTPFLLINVFAILFALSGTATVTVLLLSVSMFYALIVVPILFIYHQGINNGAADYAFYASILTSVIILFFSYLFWRWMLIEKLSELQFYLENLPF
ncbi:hypothetical protein [Halobacillus andaensis]|uniref:hypothetical protein n=1 Tax=Halobacillus andaensis TaxID=1176239 RepID=UPI003D7520FC